MGDTKRLTTEIEIKALISSAERDLKAFKESLDSMWKSGEPPKGLLRTFEGLRQRLQSLRQFSDQGVLDLSELKTAKADCEAYTKTIRQLMVEFKLLTEEQKLAMLGSEEQETIKKREDAIKAYTKELQKNTEEKRRNASIIQEKKKTTEEKQTLLNTKEQELEAIPQETRKAAEAYQKRLEEIAAINAKIKEQEELIDKYRKQRLSENPKSKNKLTASIDRYSELMFQRQQLGNPETEDPNGKVAFEQYSALFSTVTSLRAEIKSLNEEMETLGGGDKAIDARTTKKFEELKETLKSLGVEGAESAESLEDLEKIVQQLKSGAIQGLDGEIEQVERELESMGKTAGETGDRIEEAFDKLNNKKDHDQQVKNLQEKIKQFLGLQGAVELMRRAMSNAFSTIKDLDSAMKEMAVVTDLSVGDYWGQLPEYAARASELGVSIKSAYEAATLYYQQGLKANEVTELSAQTLKMASIAGIDAAEATNKMTAALRGFNMELNEASAQRVADVYSELAAITAADVGQISSAMTKTASIASSAGMEFETTAAFLSQIIETTQESAETAGTAMKTVIARFQELKKAPSEIGEVDGEIVDANAIETALRTVGVSLRDASGQFRELDDVFLELSSKWDGLDKNTQRYIATIAAGSRQQSRFIAMMSDYSRTQELVSAANNSAGASAEQYEKTLESLEAKLNKLKNAWDQFTMGIMNDDLIKLGIDALTKFLQIVNKATDGLNSAGNSISKIASVVVIFKAGQKIFEKFKPLVQKFLFDIVEEFREAGYEAGRGYAEGVGRGVSGGDNKRELTEEEKKKQEKEKQRIQRLFSRQAGITEKVEKKRGNFGGFLKAAGSTVGLEQFMTAHEARKAATEARKQAVKTLQRQALTEIETARIGELRMLRVDDAIRTEYSELSAGHESRQKRIQELSSRKELTQEEQMERDSLIGQQRRQKALEKTVGFRSAEQLEKEHTELVELEKKKEEYAKKEQDYQEQTQSYMENQQKMWDGIGAGIKKTGESLMGLGVATSVLGGLLEELGLEELGEWLSNAGQWITSIGTAIVTLGPIFTGMMQTMLKGAQAFQAAGVKASLAWTWVALIAAAIALVIAGTAYAISYIMQNSPEGKLKKAQKAQEEANKAAEEAEERYTKLTETLDTLGDKYAVIEDLTYGTKEWNNAVSEVNETVLDLIDNYPDLMKYVKATDGLLKLDTNSEEVQAELQKIQSSALMSKAFAQSAQISALEVQQTKAFTETDVGSDMMKKQGWSKFWGGSLPVFGIGNVTRNLGEEWGGNFLSYLGAFGVSLLGPIGGMISGITTANSTKWTDSIEKVTNDLAEKLTEDPNASVEELTEIIQKQQGLTGDQQQRLKEEIATEEGRRALIEFGRGVEEINKKLKLVAETMSQTAQQMANIQGWSENEKRIASNFGDGEAIYAWLREEKNNLSTAFSENKTKKLDPLVKEDMIKAVQETLGVSSVRLDDKTGKFYYRKDNVDAEVTYTEEELVDLVASYRATQKSIFAKENSRNFINSVSKDFINSSEGTEIFTRLLSFDDGEGLLKRDLADLQSLYDRMENDTVFKDRYKAVVDTYFGSWEVLMGKIETAINEATEAFDIDFGAYGMEEVEEVIKDASSGLWNQLKEIAERISKENVKYEFDKEGALGDLFVTLFEKIPEEKMQEFANLLSTSEFTTKQGLSIFKKALGEYELDSTFIDQLVAELDAATMAVDAFATTIIEYSDFVRANLRLEELGSIQEKLLWDLDSAKERGSENAYAEVGQIYSDLVNNLGDRYSEKKNVVSGARENFEKHLYQGITLGTSSGLELYEYMFDDKNNFIGFDKAYEELSKFDKSDSRYQQWDAYFKDAEKYYDDYQNAQKQLREHLEDIKEIESLGKEAYFEVRDLVKNTIEQHLEEQITLQKDSLNATKEASSSIVNKINEQISKSRENRENQEARKNITDMYSQLAYLSANTIGDELARRELEESIQQTEQDYQDTLIDQAVQDLEDANEKAFRQRERQINIAEQSLDAYLKSNEFQDHIDDRTEELLDKDWAQSELGRLIIENTTSGMSDQEITEFLNSFNSNIALGEKFLELEYGYRENENGEEVAFSWKSFKQDLDKDLDAIIKNIANLKGDSLTRGIDSQVHDLTQRGFGYLVSEIETDSRYDQVEQATKISGLHHFTGREGSEEDRGALGARLEALGEFGEFSEVLTYIEYVESVFNDPSFDPNKTDTYTAYLTQKVAERSSVVAENAIKEYKEGSLTAEQAIQQYTTANPTATGSDFYRDAGVEASVISLSDQNSNGVNSYTLDKNKWAAVHPDKSDWDHYLVYPVGTMVNSYLPKDWQRERLWASDPQPKNFDLALIGDDMFLYTGADWVRILKTGHSTYKKDENSKSVAEHHDPTYETYYKRLVQLRGYKTGGLADFTGPAWLDGTPSKPEYILNAAQTERFFSLINVLENIDRDGEKTSRSGDNYFDIAINVERLENDYDVEKIADKIRRMIAEDASYRNVNTINHIR